jgi:UDP-glucose 4-epimerase
MTLPLTWVIGSGGLLGSNVEMALSRRGSVWRPARKIPWATPEARNELEAAVSDFAAAVKDGPWRVAWCAGTGVTATRVDALSIESAICEAVFDALSQKMPQGSDGGAFLASSAGGVYAGSDAPPFTEDTLVRPVSPYGDAKLRLEQLVAAWASATGWPVVIGRIANLYGSGQNLSKPQGLISQICRAQLLRQPISIFVPLDTIREYVFAPDCGELVADGLARLDVETRATGPAAHVKILASQRGVTIATVLGEFRRIFKRSPNIVHSMSSTARFQARDLRLRSVVWPEIDQRTLTPLSAGIRSTVEDLSRRLQAGRL